MRIDTSLTNPLRFLPKGSFGGKAADEGTIVANLAFRNLTRAQDGAARDRAGDGRVPQGPRGERHAR